MQSIASATLTIILCSPTLKNSFINKHIIERNCHNHSRASYTLTPGLQTRQAVQTYQYSTVFNALLFALHSSSPVGVVDCQHRLSAAAAASLAVVAAASAARPAAAAAAAGGGPDAVAELAAAAEPAEAEAAAADAVVFAAAVDWLNAAAAVSSALAIPTEKSAASGVAPVDSLSPLVQSLCQMSCSCGLGRSWAGQRGFPRQRTVQGHDLRRLNPG